MKKLNPLILAIVPALLVLAAFTIVNKRWWGKRITARWDVHTGTEAGDPWTIYGPDWKKWSIPQLVDAWRNGKAGWFKKGESPAIQTGAQFES